MPLGSKMDPSRESLAPIYLQWEKHKKNLLRNHRAQSFHVLSVAMYSGPLYKSCQPCPWGSYRPCPGGGGGGGSWVKHKKNLLLQNHKTQSVHILFVAIYSVPLYKSCQPRPWGSYRPRPGGGGSWVKQKNLLLAQSFHILFVAIDKCSSL